MIDTDAWRSRICIFWYIVLIDITFHLLLANTKLPAILVIAALRQLGWQGASESVLYGMDLWLNIAVRIVEFAVMVYWLKRPGRSVLSEFGFRKEDVGRGIAAGVMISVVLGGGFFLAELIVSKWANVSLVAKLGFAGTQVHERAPLYIVSFLLAGCGSAAFFEDVLFVGLLFGALRKRFSLPTAFSLALGHFVAAHIIMNLLSGAGASDVLKVLVDNYPQILIWVAGGALFISLYARFKTLIPSMIVHFVGNLIMFLSGFFFEVTG